MVVGYFEMLIEFISKVICPNLIFFLRCFWLLTYWLNQLACFRSTQISYSSFLWILRIFPPIFCSSLLSSLAYNELLMVIFKNFISVKLIITSPFFSILRLLFFPKRIDLCFCFFSILLFMSTIFFYYYLLSPLPLWIWA